MSEIKKYPPGIPSLVSRLSLVPIRVKSSDDMDLVTEDYMHLEPVNKKVTALLPLSGETLTINIMNDVEMHYRTRISINAGCGNLGKILPEEFAIISLALKLAKEIAEECEETENKFRAGYEMRLLDEIREKVGEINAEHMVEVKDLSKEKCIATSDVAENAYFNLRDRINNIDELKEMSSRCRSSGERAPF